MISECLFLVFWISYFESLDVDFWISVQFFLLTCCMIMSRYRFLFFVLYSVWFLDFRFSELRTVCLFDIFSFLGIVISGLLDLLFRLLDVYLCCSVFCRRSGFLFLDCCCFILIVGASFLYVWSFYFEFGIFQLWVVGRFLLTFVNLPAVVLLSLSLKRQQNDSCTGPLD